MYVVYVWWLSDNCYHIQFMTEPPAPTSASSPGSDVTGLCVGSGWRGEASVGEDLLHGYSDTSRRLYGQRSTTDNDRTHSCIDRIRENH